ncbi:MAG: ABC transporter ATP-binding protein, partial [Bacteroidota bacterium]|nr:ABC transporter ATP-binding protein [Bacteroidota bacterium]
MIRGAGIAMIFQDPMSSLNPVFTIGEQLIEVLLHHRHMDRRTARTRAVDMLGHVGLPDPPRIMRSYPHQLSGGMRQRILIAMSLLCSPDVLIADEPTTAIDVTVQIQILALLRRLKAEMGMAVLLISHDLSVVAEICNAVAVMYAAQIVEQAPVTDLFERPLHPYTVGLLESIPAHNPPKHRLPEIDGQVPHPRHYPVGCRFAPRCRIASEVCILHKPILQQVEEGHSVACWNWPRTPECCRHREG